MAQLILAFAQLPMIVNLYFSARRTWTRSGDAVKILPWGAGL